MFHGTNIIFSTLTQNYLNPLDANGIPRNELVLQKAEFMLGICEKCKGEKITGKERSIIDRCLKELYKERLLDMQDEGEAPEKTLKDFYEILKEQEQEEAQELAIAMEIFIEGSLNIFAHPTNVDMNNRLTVFGIRDLGKELSVIAVYVMLETIKAKVAKNKREGKATWLYVEEFQTLLGSEFATKYLDSVWKQIRKDGGLCTAIAQQINKILDDPGTEDMISNSEFIILMKQGVKDTERLANVLGISEEQFKYVTNNQPGSGLMKHGSVVIPFDNEFTETEKQKDPIYKAFNTNPHEIVEN